MDTQPRSNYSLIWLALTVSLAAAGCPSSGGGSDKPSVSLKPSSEKAEIGSTVEYTVRVQNIKDAYYAAFDLTYDPDMMEFVSADEGSFLGQDGTDDTLFAVALEGGQPGRLVIGVSRQSDAGGVSGSGPLLALTFRATSAGTSTIAFDEPRAFRDPEDNDVEVESWDGGELTVQ